MKKITELFDLARDKVGQFSFPKSSMRYIIGYAVLVAGCALLYVFAWCFEWWISGKADLPALLQFLHEIASAPWVALIGFLAKAFIDRNNDGVPDEFEERKDDHNG